MAKVPPEPGAPHALALVRIPFNGGFIEAGLDELGEIWVAIRRFCEDLGVSHQGQFVRLRRLPWATIKLILTVAEDGKVRELAAVNLDTLAMWLATIDANRVREEVRPALIHRQKGAARAVRQHFFPKLGGPPELVALQPAPQPHAREPPEPAELAAAAELLGGIDPRVRAALRKLPPPRRPSVEHWLGQARELAQLVERSDVPLPADSLTCARLASSLILATSAAPDHPLVLGTRDDLRRTLALIDRLLTRAACDLELEARVTDLRARWLRESAHLTR